MKGSIMRSNSALSLITVLTVCAMLTGSCGGPGDQVSEDTGPVDDTGDRASSAQAFILADSASVAVSSCSYSFTIYGTGGYSDSPVLSGTLMGRVQDEDDFLLMVTMGQDTAPGSGDPVILTMIAAVGVDSAYALDLVEETFHRGAIEEGGRDLLRYAGYAIMNELFLTDPFSDEINSMFLDPQGIDSVGGVQCSVFLVTYSGGQESRWYLGSEDNLPRRVDRIRVDAEGNTSSVVLEISDLEVNSHIPDSIFRLTPPDGMDVINYCAFLKIGNPAPVWTLQDTAGNTVSLDDLRGNVVVLDFWATWCGPCSAVMPQIQALHEAYSGDPVRIYGVNVRENGDPEEFMLENGYTYGLLLDGDEVGEEYLVSGIPTLYVIDQQGNVAFSEVGSSPELGVELTAVIDDLLSGE